MQSLHFKIVENPEEAEKIWEIFSPHKKLDDEWNFRYTWMKYLNIPLHFIVGFDNEKPVGLLALQYNTGKGLSPKLLNMDKPFLEFFGGVDTDDNRVFLLPGYEKYMTQFLEKIHQTAVLTSLSNEYKVGSSESVFYLDRFEVDLNGITDFDSYIDLHLSGKARRNVKHELRRSKLEGYKVDIVDGDESDLEQLFQFSIDRFGERSSFHREDRRKVYYDFLKLYPVDIFKVLLDGVTKAVVYGIVYNKTYTGINVGYDYSVPSFGKFLLSATVPRAIKLGCTLYDVGQGDNGYKSRLHITQIPQYKLALNS